MSLKKKIKSTTNFISLFTKKYGVAGPFALCNYLKLNKEMDCTLALYLETDIFRMPKEEKENIYYNAEYFKLCYKINPEINHPIIGEKTNYITRIPDFLGRDCLNLREASLEEFSSFVKEHPTFFAKRSFMPFGEGLKVYRNVRSQDIPDLYQTCQNERKYMIEEFITQHPEMDKLFPNVLSTLRLCTLRTKEGIQLIFNPELAIATTGETDSIHSQKPLYKIWIHKETGKLYDKAFLIDNVTGKMTYEDTYHKDTKTVFADFTIPYWQECLNMVTEAAECFPELSYIGWDMGISEHGPVIIEGNAISGHISAYQRMMYLHNGGKNAGIKKETVALLEKGVLG